MSQLSPSQLTQLDQALLATPVSGGIIRIYNKSNQYIMGSDNGGSKSLIKNDTDPDLFTIAVIIGHTMIKDAVIQSESNIPVIGSGPVPDKYVKLANLSTKYGQAFIHFDYCSGLPSCLIFIGTQSEPSGLINSSAYAIVVTNHRVILYSRGILTLLSDMRHQISFINNHPSY